MIQTEMLNSLFTLLGINNKTYVQQMYIQEYQFPNMSIDSSPTNKTIASTGQQFYEIEEVKI